MSRSCAADGGARQSVSAVCMRLAVATCRERWNVHLADLAHECQRQ